MPRSFWIRRYVNVALIAFVVIAAGQLVSGHGATESLRHAAFWAAVSALLFTLGRYVQARRGQHCALCQDSAAPD